MADDPWLRALPGVKDVIDGTGATDVTLPRRSALRVSGAGVTVNDNPVDERIDMVVTGGGGSSVVRAIYHFKLQEFPAMGADEEIWTCTVPDVTPGEALIVTLSVNAEVASAAKVAPFFRVKQADSLVGLALHPYQDQAIAGADTPHLSGSVSFVLGPVGSPGSDVTLQVFGSGTSDVENVKGELIVLVVGLTQEIVFANV